MKGLTITNNDLFGNKQHVLKVITNCVYHSLTE